MDNKIGVAMTNNNSSFTDPLQLPNDIKRKLIIIRNNLVKREYEEAYHVLYSIASPNFDKPNAWEDLEDSIHKE